MRRSFLIAAAVLFLLIIGIICVLRTRIAYYLKRGSLNVLLISIDTLRADRVGCYGFRDIETPNIDRICKEGVKFENCVAQVPLTLPSHTTVLSGTYPLYHNIRDNLMNPRLLLIGSTLDDLMLERLLIPIMSWGSFLTI